MAALVISFLAPALCVGGQERIGTVIAVKGEVSVERNGVRLKRGLKVMDPIMLHDRIATPPGASVRIILTDDSVVTIGEKSSLAIADYVYNSRKRVRRGILDLILGGVRTQLNRAGFADEEFIVRTSNAIAGVKGTDFVVTTTIAERTKVFVLEGRVSVANVASPQERRIVGAGSYTLVEKKRIPLKPQPMSEAVLREIENRFSLRATAARGAADLPRAGAALRGSIPPSGSRAEQAAADRAQPGGAPLSAGFYNPQASGQIGLEPPPVGIAGGAGASGSAAPSRPSSPGRSGGFPRKALEEVFGAGH